MGVIRYASQRVGLNGRNAKQSKATTASDMSRIIPKGESRKFFHKKKVVWEVGRDGMERL